MLTKLEQKRVTRVNPFPLEMGKKITQLIPIPSEGAMPYDLQEYLSMNARVGMTSFCKPLKNIQYLGCHPLKIFDGYDLQLLKLFVYTRYPLAFLFFR